MNEKITQFISTKGLPIFLFLALACFAVYSTNFSISGYIVDKVIDKMDAKYSPYGPNNVDPRKSSDAFKH